ncbi:MAG: Uncharacterised protein [Synechococcus sp. CC9902]|nr:MAG: Uncharacterised protein [Synechococcus sp. CC9902]
MGEGRAANDQVGIFKDHAALFRGGPHPVHLQRVADAGGAVGQSTLQKAFQGVRSVEVNSLIAVPGQSQAGQETGQTEDMISMHVGDEHPSQLGQPQIAAQELMLGAFTAVEQPHLRALRQPQCDG